MKKTHKMPLICKIHKFLHGQSPSATIWCTAKVGRRTAECEGCEKRLDYNIYESFMKGYTDALKNIKEGLK